MRRLAEGDDRNHHARVLTTTRKMGAEGLGKKTRVLDAPRTGGPEIVAMRAVWAELQNAALERAGVEVRVDHRSLEAQREAAEARGDLVAAEELDRAPEVNLGPAVNAMERRAAREAEAAGRDYAPVTERARAALVGCGRCSRRSASCASGSRRPAKKTEAPKAPRIFSAGQGAAYLRGHLLFRRPGQLYQ